MLSGTTIETPLSADVTASAAATATAAATAASTAAATTSATTFSFQPKIFDRYPVFLLVVLSHLRRTALFYSCLYLDPLHDVRY